MQIAKKEFSWKRPGKSLGRWTMQGNKQMNVRPAADQQDCGLYFTGYEFCFYIKNEITGLQCRVTNVCSFEDINSFGLLKRFSVLRCFGRLHLLLIVLSTNL